MWRVFVNEFGEVCKSQIRHGLLSHVYVGHRFYVPLQMSFWTVSCLFHLTHRCNYLTPLGPLSEANLFLALVVLNPSPLSLSHSHTHLEFGAPSVTSALGENPDLGRGIWHPENLSKGKMTQS